MPAFRITLAYDGTDYVGWQRQPSGASIQGLVEDALFPFEDRPVRVTGAGRTDAGVHAIGQVVAFSLARSIEPATLVRALNARLPPAVRVLDAAHADAAFHPRFSATAKTYRYTICTGEVIPPFAFRYAWHYPGPLDLQAMADAASCLVGEHDFASFQGTGADVETTVRTVYHSAIEQAAHAPVVCDAKAGYVTYTARGNGFLRHMVRAIVGTLVEVGRGRRPSDWMREVLAARDRRAAGVTVPACGLCLVSVEYPPGELAAQP